MQCDHRQGDSLVLIGTATFAEAPSPGQNPVRYPCSLQRGFIQSATWQPFSSDTSSLFVIVLF